MNKLTKEFYFFRQQPHNMKVLLLTNLCFAFVLPVVEIFVNAYIMRNTNSSTFVMLYQLAMYTGVVVSSVINGELLKHVKVKTLYGSGILVSGLAMLLMMTAKTANAPVLIVTGLSLGIATGFFWTNRYLLALKATNDDNRNYFTGLESFFFSVCNIAVPLITGAFLVKISESGLFGIRLDINSAYQAVTVAVFAITVIACLVLWQGVFENPAQKKYLYFRFNLLWRKLICLAALKGLVQGFLVTAPAILVLKLLGGEGELGLIQGVGGLITAVIVYILGRTTRPKHRNIVFATGIVIFFAGTLFNAVLFSAFGVIVFMSCKIFFQPLHDLAYFPIMMRTVDIVSGQENRSPYAYIMNHEIGLFIGRAAGLLLFILLATYVSELFALKYALLTVAGIQLLSIPLSGMITKKTSKIK